MAKRNKKKRRLATQSRGGAVKSNRDYQEIVTIGIAPLIEVSNSGRASLKIQYSLEEGLDGYICAGGYISSSKDGKVDFRIYDSNSELIGIKEIKIGRREYWNRFGNAMKVDSSPTDVFLEFSWSTDAELQLWGLACDLLIPGENCSKDIEPHLLNKTYQPEIFYFTHDLALCGGNIAVKQNIKISQERGKKVECKKCSQCQRYLPIDPNLVSLRKANPKGKRAPNYMVLGFHGHRSKRTGYQNECRMCKKIEINDHFNPMRTADQLHESSTLTRERKLLLQENQILQDFKARRNKLGLRTFVWERFDRKCFRCNIPVTKSGFELDHTRPLAYLWPLDEYATCLCAPCNNKKHDAFPADFYSAKELKKLASVIKLPIQDLQEKFINPNQLNRIIKDVSLFAENWSARLFGSVAERVEEFHPDIDLFQLLDKENSILSKKIAQELESRPDPVRQEP